MALPVKPGPMPRFEFIVDVAEPTTLRAELRVSDKPENHTPDVTLAALEVKLAAGAGQKLPLEFSQRIDSPRYAFVCLMANKAVAVHLSDQRLTGVLALCHKGASDPVSHHGFKPVEKSSTQTPPPGIGFDTFELWPAHRRPGGKNLALRIQPPLKVFGVENLTSGFARPTNQANAWVADSARDERPVLKLTWPKPQIIGRIELRFDTDFDHPMESVLGHHPENVMPFCVREVEIAVPEGSNAERVVFQIAENHQTRQVIHLKQPVTTDCLKLRFAAPAGGSPVALFEVRCYAQD
jgi:hypothetical protein